MFAKPANLRPFPPLGYEPIAFVSKPILPIQLQ
jgi:hypothetical protein